MPNPTYEILESVGDIRKVHLVSTGGYDEIQHYKASAGELVDILENATAHFEQEHEVRIPRLNALHIPENENDPNEVPVTVQDGVVVPLP